MISCVCDTSFALQLLRQDFLVDLVIFHNENLGERVSVLLFEIERAGVILTFSTPNGLRGGSSSSGETAGFDESSRIECILMSGLSEGLSGGLSGGFGLAGGVSPPITRASNLCRLTSCAMSKLELRLCCSLDRSGVGRCLLHST